MADHWSVLARHGGKGRFVLQTHDTSSALGLSAVSDGFCQRLPCGRTKLPSPIAASELC
jgi:hypothetical protein